MVEGESLSREILISILISTEMTTTQNTRTHLKILHLARSQPLTTKLTTASRSVYPLPHPADARELEPGGLSRRHCRFWVLNKDPKTEQVPLLAQAPWLM